MYKNIRLIIAREYLTRVKKKSFLLMTFLTPLAFVGVFGFIFWVSVSSIFSEKTAYDVVDESQLFENSFKPTKTLKFNYLNEGVEAGKSNVENDLVDGFIYIPKLKNLDNPKGIILYAKGNPSVKSISTIEKRIQNEIKNIKLLRSGIDKQVLDKLKTIVDLQSINLASDGTETKSSSGAATGIGYAGAFMIYIFIFAYGAQCMRGVIEEKTSRIVEIIISSVKPFELMIGKVVGIAAVGITQIALWVILTFSLGSLAVTMMDGDTQKTIQQSEMVQENDQQENIQNVIANVRSINIPLTLFAFIFYFVGGYLLYSALFAAVGSSVDSDADAQQFMFPITIPLIAAIASLSAVLVNPNGTFSFWMSMIPLTSPVVMMMRVPFGIPTWQLVLSMLLVILGFLFTIWVASRIYRIGILMHGTKVNYRVLLKWFLTKS